MIKHRLFIAFAITSLCGMMSSWGRTNTTAEDSTLVEIDSTEIIAEQEARAAKEAESAEKAKERQELIATLSKNFNEKKDEFSEKIWVKPTNCPKYRNRNATYCYFMKVGNEVSNFRFVLQYENDKWLFIKDLIFNIDGTNYGYRGLNFETDCGNGGRIWEWCDLQFNDVSLIKALENAKSVKIKMNGRQYYDIRTLSSKDLTSIQNTIKYYKALGGKFN